MIVVEHHEVSIHSQQCISGVKGFMRMKTLAIIDELE